MSGTKRGGLRAAKTNKQRYGSDFYKIIGRMGGRVSQGGGFAKDPNLAREAGRLGGKSKRSKRTHCQKRGHKLTDRNVIMVMGATGPYRRCLQCLAIEHPNSKLLRKTRG